MEGSRDAFLWIVLCGGISLAFCLMACASKDVLSCEILPARGFFKV